MQRVIWLWQKTFDILLLLKSILSFFLWLTKIFWKHFLEQSSSGVFCRTPVEKNALRVSHLTVHVYWTVEVHLFKFYVILFRISKKKKHSLIFGPHIKKLMTANKLLWSIESLLQQSTITTRLLTLSRKKSGSNSLQKRKVWIVLKPKDLKYDCNKFTLNWSKIPIM